MIRSLLALCLLLVVADAAGAEEARWTRGEGYYDLKGDVTEAEAKSRALQAARAQAIEKAVGLEVKDQFIDVVVQRNGSGGDFSKREVATLVLGVIKDSRKASWQVKAIGSGDTAFIRYTFEGEFLVARRPRGQAPFSIDLKLPRSKVLSGDDMSLVLSASEILHAAVFTLGADDRVYVLYPNRHRENLVVPAGKGVSLPSPQDPFTLKPSNLPGHREDHEVLRVVASRSPIRPPAAGPDGSLDLGAFYDWLYGLEPGTWAEDSKPYSIIAMEAKP